MKKPILFLSFICISSFYFSQTSSRSFEVVPNDKIIKSPGCTQKPNTLPTPVKNIIKVTDLTGQECNLEFNKFLIIYFDDSSIEKGFIEQ